MTDRYIDFLRGSDASADPTNPATPWQNLAKIITVAAGPGDRFLLADDSHFIYPVATRLAIPGTWTGTKENPTIIGKYTPAGSTNAGGRPKITWHDDVASGSWVDDTATNNAWYYDVGTPPGSVAFVKVGSAWLANTASTTALPLASVDGLYKVSTNRVYLYAPAGIDPTTYYGRVLIAPVGAPSLFQILSRTCYVEFQDLLITESGSIVHLYSGATSDCGITLRGWRMRQGSSICSIQPSTVATGMDVLIDDLQSDDFGACAIWGLSNGAGTVRNFELRRSRFTNGPNGTRQGQVYLQVRMRSCAIHDNYFGSSVYGGYSTPFDGCGLYFETGSDGGVAYSNTFENHCRAVTLNSGRTSVIRDNVFKNCWQAVHMGDGTDIDATNYTITGNTMYVGADVPPQSGYSYPTGMGLSAYFVAANTNVSLKITNNVLVNLGARLNNYEGALLLWGSKTAGSYTLDVSNNTISNFQYMATAQGSGVETATINTVNGDPQLGSTYRPKIGSPVLKTGKLIAVGSRDFAGIQRPNPPSRGAHDVATLRRVL